MAHDARREDYQRLALRFARELEREGSHDAARAFASFGRRFAQDRDSLPQTDADRAFHLVALAAEVVDYRLPFATDDQAPALIARGRALLDEALALDPSCHDAARMRSSSESPSIEGRYRFLLEGESAVRTSCETARDEAATRGDDERAALEADLAMRPWRRWMASLAEEALICGRNRVAIDVAERLLEEDPHDSSGVRHTLAYALAKLEDAEGLDALGRRCAAIAPARGDNDPWMALARVSLAHAHCDVIGAREQLSHLLETYPGAGVTLIRQVELPDGEFARLRVAPFSEDELVIATSEGVVLLQEGNDRSGKGVLGSWVAREVARLDPEAARVAEREASGKGAQRS